MTEVPKTSGDLKEMVYHTDARVTAMEGRLGTIDSNQQRQEAKLDTLIHHLNQPRNVNWAGWGGLGLGVLLALFGAAKFMVEYTSLTDVPIQKDIAVLRSSDSVFSEFQRATHYRFGEFDMLTKTIQSDQKHKDDLYHKLDDRVRELESKAAAAEISRRAIGDYVKEIDRLGSRVWIGRDTGK